MTSAIKILELDIETAPTTALVWGTYKPNIAVNQIVKPGYMLCFAAKWQHQKSMVFVPRTFDRRGNPTMLELLWPLLDDADVVVHYNGKSFDIKHIQKEFVLADMPPPSPFHQIDLLTVVRRQFKFVSNKLDFVARELGCGNKTRHQGMDLWVRCMAQPQDKAAWEIMRKYNMQDVRILGKLYKKLQPWITSHPNRTFWTGKPGCPNCGSPRTQLMPQVRRTKCYEIQQYRCLKCMAYSDGQRKRVVL